MLTRTELRMAGLFLRHAETSVRWVATMFYADGNTGAAARLNAVAVQLSDALRDIDALLKALP